VNPLGCLLAPGLAAACGLMVSLNASAQSPPAAHDLARQLFTRIAAAAVPLQEVQLALVDADDDSDAITRDVAADLQVLLRDRGIRLVVAAQARQAGVPVLVRLTCSANLREDVCAAEIVKSESRDVAIASRPRETVAGRTQTPVMALDVRPLFAAQVPILDAAVIGEHLVVLHTEGIALYDRAAPTPQAKASVPLPSPRPWPRDVRGRLRVDGDAVAAFVPGVSCHGTLEPLAVKCAEGNEPWPLGIPAATPASGLNYFTSPKTPSFFSTASIGAAGWLLAATDGRLLLVEQSLEIRRTLPAVGDDIAGVTTACGGGRQVIAASSQNGAAAGALRAFELTGRNLVEVAPALSIPGRVTALWEAPGTPFVLVVAHNVAANRYEAFQVGISCTR